MEITEQIELFDKYFTKHKESLKDSEVKLDLKDLQKSSKKLYDELIINPADTIRAAEIAIDKLTEKDEIKRKLRITNVPEELKIEISEFRVKDLHHLVLLDVFVQTVSDIKPKIVSSKFECPSCGNIITVIQIDSKFKEPRKCGCGRTGRFRIMSNETVDSRTITCKQNGLKIDIEVTDKLVEEDFLNKECLLIGILEMVPQTKGQSKLTINDFKIEANNIEEGHLEEE